MGHMDLWEGKRPEVLVPCASVGDPKAVFVAATTMSFTICFTTCFTICWFISPDLDGHRAPKMKYCPDISVHYR